MLMRTDPLGGLDRLAQQVLGTLARPAQMPMDAWRESDRFIVELDLPGLTPEAIAVDVEGNVLTVHAERPAPESTGDLLVSERPQGVFSRQLILGDTLDPATVNATYRDGVLRLETRLAEKAKPRKIAVGAADTRSSLTAGKGRPEVSAGEEEPTGAGAEREASVNA